MEGALLVVDAAPGIQAQTISNLYLALENDLTIIPIINKVDLPSAEPEVVKDQIIDLIGCDKNVISTNTSQNRNRYINEILKSMVDHLPPSKEMQIYAFAGNDLVIQFIIHFVELGFILE